jgi:hypothetical protein
MTKRYEYIFRIDAFRPETLPMARLADYMQDLAALLGEVAHVHFKRLDGGSVALVQDIEQPAYASVRTRLQSLERGEPAPDVVKAFNSLDARLAQDNAVGTLTCGADGVEVVRFPGRERPQPLKYGSFRQQGSLDGQLVRLGGKDKTAHATLQDGDRVWTCEMSRDLARDMREHLYEQPLRVHGEGRWRRSQVGDWTLERFVATHFEVLDPATWPDTVARLRSIGGS